MPRALLSITILAPFLALCASFSAAAASFVYQGSLSSQGKPATGRHDFRFRLYDAADPASGDQIGFEVVAEAIQVRDGAFSVDLDFGPTAESMDSAWLEIEVSPGDGSGWFTVLEPRQRIVGSARAAAPGTTPSGAVVFFDLTSCPSGWSEYTSARGRAVVGLNSGGTLGGQNGTALTNLQTKTHTHDFTVGATASSAGNHNHVWAYTDINAADFRWFSYDSQGDVQLVWFWDNLVGIGGGSGSFPLTAGPNTTWYTDIGGAHTHSVSSGSLPTESGGGSLPYIQLLACAKD